MAIVTAKPVRILTLEYRPEETDLFSCAWAVFKFDLDNYSLSIEGDCGNYTYTGWTPTPDKESFLKLCQRFDKGYLLEKLANKTVLNHNKTYQSIKDFLRINDLYFDIDTDKREEFHEALKDCIIHGSNDERTLADAIEDVLDDYGLEDEYCDFDIFECFEKDYPARAKTIVDIFFEYIIPVLPQYDK